MFSTSNNPTLYCVTKSKLKTIGIKVCLGDDNKHQRIVVKETAFTRLLVNIKTTITRDKATNTCIQVLAIPIEMAKSEKLYKKNKYAGKNKI